MPPSRTNVGAGSRAARPRRPATAGAKPRGRPAAKPNRSIHELRNCLAVIANAVYYLKLVAPPDDRVRKYLRILERAAKAASRLIDRSTGSEAPPSIDEPPGVGRGVRA